MIITKTPSTLFHAQIVSLREHLPGVLDGKVESVHDARIATRRIRELLPLVADRRRTLDELQTRFKQMGRALGRVRDADVQIELLSALESRQPHAAPALVGVRQRHEAGRLDRMRRLIKRFERLGVAGLVDELVDSTPGRPPLLPWRNGRGWRRRLQATVRDRASSAAAAIDHATGVYFPNRAHAARIAIKKLRYALEIAHQTEAADHDGEISELKKGQDLLGELHDRQVLIDELTGSPAQGGDKKDKEENPLAPVVQMLEADCHTLHARYVERRDKIRHICVADFSAVGNGRSRLRAVTVGALALSSGYAVYRRALRPGAEG